VKTESQIKFNDRLIRLPELELIFGVCARTVRRKSEIGEFPPLVKSGGVVGMLESKVKEHFERLSVQTAICV
jgi:predicted DNA-binding transcriptional regulator AlpA